MNATAWKFLALVTLGPIVGWLAHDWWAPEPYSMLGAAVVLSWSGLFFVLFLSCVDWRNTDL
jgi:hypothetical protein